MTRRPARNRLVVKCLKWIAQNLVALIHDKPKAEARKLNAEADLAQARAFRERVKGCADLWEFLKNAGYTDEQCRVIIESKQGPAMQEAFGTIRRLHAKKKITIKVTESPDS